MPINLYIDTVFGVDGDLTTVPDATQVDGTVSFEQGYPAGYAIAPGSPGSLPIERDKFNYIMNQAFGAIQFLQQNSTNFFITTTDNGGSPFPYGLGAQVLLGGVVYQSLVGSNTDTPPSANWAVCVPFSGSVFQTGMILAGISSTPFSGFINIDGNTIGSASSGGVYAGTIYQNLYAAWWNNCSFPSGNAVATVAGGLGVSAAADFAANKPITMPNSAGKVIVGFSSFFNQSGQTFGANAVAAAGTNGDTGSHSLSVAEVPSLSITVGQYVVSNSSTGAILTPAGTPGSTPLTLNTNGGGGGHLHAGSTFTGSPTSVVQPSLAAYYQIAL